MFENSELPLNSNQLDCAMVVGIDDYLMTYEHEQSEIEDFIASLDRPLSSSALEVDPEGSRQHTVAAHSAPWQNCFDLTWSTEASSAELKREVDTTSDFRTSDGAIFKVKRAACALKITKVGIPPKSRTVPKQAKPKAPEENPTERRRIQNREAQRRYRERHMLASYRRLGANFFAYNCLV